jgi:hypothetical protein
MAGFWRDLFLQGVRGADSKSGVRSNVVFNKMMTRDGSNDMIFLSFPRHDGYIM